MPSSHPIPSLEYSSTRHIPRSRARRSLAWLREPFLHFIVLGAMLFLADRLFIQRDDDPRTIVVGRNVDSEAVEIFKASRGREPDAKERAALHRVWLDNEVLYREGLAMQVDKGDDAIRERVIFKALSVVDANVRLPDIDDAALRNWFEQNRSRYDEPSRLDFDEAVLAGEAKESSVRDLVSVLNTGTPGDAGAGLRVFKGRPESNLVQSYGEEFARAVVRGPLGHWQAIRTRDGWRAIRLEAITPPKPADYQVLRGVVLQDWKDATASEQRSAAVRALARKYTVRFESVPSQR